MPADANDHLAFLRELDGVSYEIDQNLPEPDRVSDQVERDIWTKVAGQFQLLLVGADGQFFNRPFDHFPEIKLHVLKFQVARLHLGKIEDVIDNIQEVFSRIFEDFHIMLLFGGQGGLHQELRHADNGIHGGPYFMAHGGQKIRLGQVGRFGFFLGLEERLLGPIKKVVAEGENGAAQAGIELFQSKQQGVTLKFPDKDGDQDGAVNFKGFLNF
ncbi:MAG: hypothetical protein A4E70_01264 [Syntrophus sp. PtaU1.Bin005]|nr:MAG: hypothetical protein A4E70_01264 [Syntrophus sp. PtaU1.Bin005]